jgi:hypothetical protein
VILDYVPNHVAPDHPWTTARPECLLTGTEEDLARHPEAFLRTAARRGRKGRDPYFAPWPDVAQLNAFAPALREAVAQTLIAIGAQCDGLRCDMAMLMTNEVFARTWGERAGPAPPDEYWPTLIARTKAAHPDFLFLAEAYWDMEWTLQQQGFDLCYDKRLYDRLGPRVRRVGARAPAGRRRLPGALLRFIENHDEPRAAATFGAGQARAAAVAMSTLQGARLYHDGQLEGRRTRIPVFLGRGPDEPPDGDLRAFYAAAAARRRGRRPARRRLAPVRCEGWPTTTPIAGWSRGAGATRTRATSWSSTSPTPRRRRACACRGTTSRDALAADATGSTASASSAPATRSPPRGLYVALDAWASNFLALAGDD